jgi:flagellar motility protein MotE (MotC chaperone)
VDISKLSEKELEVLSKQLEEQKQIIKQEKLRKRSELAKVKIEKLREHKDVILNLIDHDRTSCSDANVCNGYGSADYGARCTKCHLIEILDNEWSDTEFEVDLHVTITKIQ